MCTVLPLPLNGVMSKQSTKHYYVNQSCSENSQPQLILEVTEQSLQSRKEKPHDTRIYSLLCLMSQMKAAEKHL